MNELDLSVLWERAKKGDEAAVDELIEVAAEQGNLEELTLADQGESTAADQLMKFDE